MNDFTDHYENSMTRQSFEAWRHLEEKYRTARLLDLALMFEARLSELDPNYRAYPFGRVKQDPAKPPKRLNAEVKRFGFI